MANMQNEYGSKKGESVFYASRNKGTISGVEKDEKKKKKKGQADAIKRAMKK